MTVCLVAALPGFTLAAADTRVTIRHGNGRLNVQDGPEDLRVHADGRLVEVPYHHRKIRFLGSGWAVTAGAQPAGSELLNALSRDSASHFDKALACLAEHWFAIEDRVHIATGLSREELRRSFVIGADHDARSGVWVLGVPPSENNDSTRRSAGMYLVNWPTDVEQSAVLCCARQFEADVQEAYSQRRPAGFLRAAARLIDSMASVSAEVSHRAQIGMSETLQPGIVQARYFDDSTTVLKSLADTDYLGRSEAVPDVRPMGSPTV